MINQLFLLKNIGNKSIFGNLFVQKVSIYKVVKWTVDFLNFIFMEILTQPNYQTKLESEIFFDKRARENYFAMLEVALKNLSLVDRKKNRSF